MRIPFKATSTLDKVFEIGILLKAFDGLLEIIGGLILLFIKPETIGNIGTWLSQQELAEDPHDFVASHIMHATHNLDHGILLFGALYLLSHGIVKVVLVAEILRNRLWAYPGLIVVTVGFILYQLYEIHRSYSIGFVLLTLFDLVIVYLTVREYDNRRRALKPPALASGESPKR